MEPTKRAVLRTEVPSDQIMRYTWVERVCHWVTAFTYLYCGFTGLAFFTPYMYWIVLVFGGGPTARFWHPIVGFGYVAAIFWMGAMWKDDFKFIPQDKEWNQKVMFYITNQDEKLPPQARFDSGQKVFFIGMIAMAVLLPLSGVVLWFPEYVPRGAHWLLPIVAFVHSAAALVSIGLIIIHVYMGTVIVPGSWSAITLGYVSRGWGMLHHPLWYRKVTEQEARK
jgi:formate dehydrogenase subunit gamma